MRSTMRTLVIGGTGYVGHRILEQLGEAGHDVAVVSRGNLEPAILHNVQHFKLDRKDREAFEAAFGNEQFDVVIDNIAYDRADVESCVRAFGGRTRQYILTSSIVVYHDVTSLAPLPEDAADLTFITPEGYTKGSAPHAVLGHKYSEEKRRAELMLRELDPSVFSHTILRPPIVVGPDDRTRRVWWFVQRLLDGGPFVIPDFAPGRIFQVVYADDLARSYVAAAGAPAAMNRTYNVNNPEVFSAETWLQALATALGREASWARIPVDRLAAVDLDGYSMPIAARPYGDVRGDTYALRHDLGFEFTPEANWITDTAQGCAANPPAGDSDGYDRREQEIAVARQFQERYQAMIETL